MITIIFNPLSVSFIPVNLTIDVIAFFYDLGLALITGYVIWFKTDELVQRKDELRKYRDEQQELSRYLGRLSHAVECYTGGDERQRYTIEDSNSLDNG